MLRAQVAQPVFWYQTIARREFAKDQMVWLRSLAEKAHVGLLAGVHAQPIDRHL